MDTTQLEDTVTRYVLYIEEEKIELSAEVFIRVEGGYQDGSSTMLLPIIYCIVNAYTQYSMSMIFL